MHRYHRAYKACLACRRRKTKCVISTQEYDAGMACARCRRTMRECRFSTERSAQRDRSLFSPARPCPDTEISMDIPGALPTQVLDETSIFDEVNQDGFNCSECPQPHQQATSSLAVLEHVGSGNEESWTQSNHTNDLTSSILKTSVSRCNDALDILFAAAQSEPRTPNTRPSESENGSSSSCWAPSTQMSQDIMPDSDMCPQSIRIISSAPKSMRFAWKKCRFVRIGLLSVEEAIALVDSFFINMLPHAPNLDGFYSDHANHYQLVNNEPFLCCVLLTLSSRHHFFPTAGGRARSDLIHHSLWESCQQLLMQLMLGQERNSASKIRTLGSIEALLLLIEWHPQALHLPDMDDLGSDVSTTSSGLEYQMETRNVAKWLSTIISSSRQSHRMAGMLLGCAVALANELGIFQPPLDGSIADGSIREQRLIRRRISLAKLVFVCQQHTSARIGFTPTPALKIPHVITMVSSSPTPDLRTDDEEWHTLLAARVELAQIVRSVVDSVIPSPPAMGELIQSGRYVGMLDQFDALFRSWKSRHLDSQIWSQHFRETLNAEYYTMIIGTFSLAIQAVVDRALPEKQGPFRPIHIAISPTDYRFIEAMVDGCLEIFNIVIRLAESRRLAFAPESLFVRVTMASVFLMKAMGLGVKKSKLSHSLSSLSQAIDGLKANKPGDLHFGYQYVTLLDVCMANLGASLMSSRSLRVEQEQSNYAQSEPMVDFSTSDFSGIGELDSCFDLSCFDVLTDPLLDPLERTDIRDDTTLNHNFFTFW